MWISPDTSRQLTVAALIRPVDAHTRPVAGHTRSSCVAQQLQQPSSRPRARSLGPRLRTTRRWRRPSRLTMCVPNFMQAPYIADETPDHCRWWPNRPRRRQQALWRGLLYVDRPTSSSRISETDMTCSQPSSSSKPDPTPSSSMRSMWPRLAAASPRRSATGSVSRLTHVSRIPPMPLPDDALADDGSKLSWQIDSGVSHAH